MDEGKKKMISELLKEIKDNDYKKVVVYALDSCPACIELKHKFNNIGVTYENVSMDGNDDMWDELEKRGGSGYAPQVEIEGYLIKEDEYETINELISEAVSLMIERKVILK